MYRTKTMRASGLGAGFDCQHDWAEEARRGSEAKSRCSGPRVARFRPFAGALLLLLVASLAAGSVLAETGKPPERQAVIRGAKIYQNNCQSCHGQRGIGEPVYPWNLGKRDYFPAPALDDSQHAWHHSDEDLVKFILNGSPRTSRMPAWRGTLSERNVRDVVSYMKSLWSRRALECQGPRHMACM